MSSSWFATVHTHGLVVKILEKDYTFLFFVTLHQNLTLKITQMYGSRTKNVSEKILENYEKYGKNITCTSFTIIA